MRSYIQKNALFNISKKNFSVLPKVTKMEVSMRTPYRTFFHKFNGFTRFYIGTIKGMLSVSNRTYPTAYLLPAGEIKFIHLQHSQGNECESGISGEFVHTGGYVVVHE